MELSAYSCAIDHSPELSQAVTISDCYVRFNVGPISYRCLGRLPTPVDASPASVGPGVARRRRSVE